tara:strand:- start:1128 stop:1721 length:594 start_codon:yes stop_codon:yes gene_type:complete
MKIPSIVQAVASTLIRQHPPRIEPMPTADPFPAILKKVLVHEGGFVDHPKDPGGATMKGVTQATYNGWRARQGKEPRSVRFITDAELTAIYRRDFWDRVRGDDLPPGINYAVFDFAVNSGVSRAARYLQKVVGVAQDGQIGPNTLSATRSKDPAAVIDQLCDDRLAFMRSLRIWPTFGKGWRRRVDDVRRVAKTMIA